MPQKKLQRLSPQAKEALAKRYKIGKYRDWVFSPERLAEITLKFEFGMKESMHKAGIKYLRNHYPQYDHLSDKEVMEQQLHKKLWQDVSERKKGKKYDRKKGKAEKKDDEELDF